MAYDDIAAAGKLRAEREHYEAIEAQAQCPQGYSSMGSAVYGDQAQANYRRPSMREEAEKSVGYHRTEADKADRAAAFFREHPEFDEFIGLIRAGVVQI